MKKILLAILLSAVLCSFLVVPATETNVDLYFGVSEDAEDGSSGGGSAAGGGGGGGGGAKVKALHIRQVLKVAPEILKIKLKQYESFVSSFKVYNNYSKPVEVNIDFDQLKDKIQISNYLDTILIDPNKEQDVKFNITAVKETKPGIYTGKIKIGSGELEKEVSIIIEVESRKVLFDVSLSVPSRSKTIYPGGELVISPTIFNLADVPKTELLVTYLIKDFDGNTVQETQEKLMMETQVSFTKTLQLPEDIKTGKYVVSVYVKYKDSFGISSETFDVIEEEKPSIINYLQDKPVFILSLLATVIIVLAAFAFISHTILKYKKVPVKNVIKIYKNRNTTNNSDSKEKIRRLLDSLNRSYQEGYITKKTYEETKQKLEKSRKS